MKIGKNKLLMLILEFARTNKLLMLMIPMKALTEISIGFITLLFSSKLLKMISDAISKEIIIRYSVKLLLLIFVLQVLMQIMTRYVEAKKRFLLEIQNRTINDKSMKMDYQNLDNAEVQRLRTRQEEFTNMTGGLYKMLIDLLERGVKSIASVICALFVMFSNNISYSWIEMNGSVVMVICFSLVAICFYGKMLTRINIETKKYMEQCMDGNRYLIYYLYNILYGYQNAKDLRIYKQQLLVLHGIREANNIFQTAGKRYAKEKRKKRYVAQIASVLPGGIIYLVTGIRAYKGMIDIGDVIRIAGGLVYFINGLSEIVELYSDSILVSSYSRDYKDYLNMNEKKGEVSINSIKKEEYVIDFENVSFCYPNSKEYILKNVNLTIKQGEKIAFVGRNGSGKTTLIKLLCGLYDVTEGTIKLNGIDIREYNYEEYNAILSAVFQDFSLFSLKIAENIAAQEEYEEKRMQEILEKSRLMEWINKLQDGLNTFIGKDFHEEGVELSGGERQKIAIARSVFKGAPIVIMDEPTAALDPIAECEVYEQFNDIVDYKIAIYISHRLAACRFCDRIIVLENGRIIQEGTHETLVGQIGLYREMWKAQAKHYKV